MDDMRMAGPARSFSKRPFSRLIFDLDGVLYRGHTPVPGAAHALARIRKAGLPVSFITNNATRSRATLQRRLASMGIHAKKDELMTSAYAAACYLRSLRPRPSSLYVLGERGLRDELRTAGFEVLPLLLRGERHSATTFSRLPRSECTSCAHVLVTGLDRQATYAKLAAALDVLHSGARWVACNLDPTLPMENGAHPGSGSLSVCLAYGAGTIRVGRGGRDGGSGKGAAGRSPQAAFSSILLREPDVVVGKPNPYMMDLLCKDCRKAERRKILFVGDRLDMDIAFAKSAGLSSLLVLSGVTGREEARKAKGVLKPDAILPSVADLPKWLGL
jgi:4-nitrophenyl phosphatase